MVLQAFHGGLLFLSIFLLMAIGRGLSKVTSPLRWLKLNWLVLVGLGSIAVKGGFKLLFYGGLKMYDLGGLRID